MSAREHNLKIGVSGIRGVIGEFLTPGLACDFGQAFGTYVAGAEWWWAATHARRAS